jgi:hypothetical protein
MFISEFWKDDNYEFLTWNVGREKIWKGATGNLMQINCFLVILPKFCLSIEGIPLFFVFYALHHFQSYAPGYDSLTLVYISMEQNQPVF